jgi:hypothetical protein
MAYVKTTWVNSSAPPINATNLNKIEDGIFDNDSAITTLDGTVSALSGTVSTLSNDFETHTTVSATLSILGHVQTGVFTATITTASWTGTTSPFTNATTVSGILATDTPIIDIVLTGTFADDEDIIENWGGVYRAETTADVVTFSATDLPTVDLPIQLKVVR